MIVARWRNIPTQFNWDGESITPAQTRRRPASVKPSKVPVAVLPPETPETSSETPSGALNLGRWEGLSEEEKLAALKTEAALEAVLSLVPEASEPAETQEVAEESEPAKIAESEEPEKVSGDRTDLWESPVQDLSVGNSAIYPDGRPLANPNHLMLFVGRGAEVVREYRQDGWVSYLLRSDGRRNPLPESLVETLIKSGVLKEGKPGVFRGDLSSYPTSV